MLIKLFDFIGAEARQIIGNAQFVVNTEKKKALIFLPEHREIDFFYYEYEINGNNIVFFLYENKDAFEKSVKK